MSRVFTRVFRPAMTSVCAFALAATLASCSSSSEGETEASSSRAPVEADETLHAMLPQEIQDSGTLKVGTEALYPPYEYLDSDGSTVIGLDIDLFDAVTDKLGIDYTLDNIAFDSLLPSLETNRYDTIVAAITDNAERQENYDFIDYFEAGQSIVVLKDNPESISSFEDLCGKTTSVLKTSAQESYLQELNETTCEGNPIDILSQQSDNDALLQVQNGRAVGVVSQDPVARYNAEKVGNGQFIVANEEPADPQPLGYVVRKGDTELANAFQSALQSLKDDGTYEEILEQHGVASGALDTITINAGS